MEKNVKTVIAMDSFKGSLSSNMAADAVENGIKKAIPNAICQKFPIADGGEGTVVALTQGLSGEFREITVKDPLSRQILARYGLINEKKTAVIEMSAAAGITLVPQEERNPMVTTTYGVGEMILDAINIGCRDFIIGIGGSATNDAGVGMFSALGFEFADKNGRQVPLGALGLRDVCKISDQNADKRLKECNFRVACDVTNPLCGDLGCSAVYGPQKGADKDSIALMDSWLENFAALAKKYNENADKDLPGAGAAGGMGFAFTAFLGGKLMSGIDLVMDVVGIEEKIKGCDLVICGEGRLDSQSAMGKAPSGVARIAKKYNKTVIALSGCTAKDAGVCNKHGIDAFFSILPNVCTLDEALDVQNAYMNLSNTAEQVIRLVAAVKKDQN